jgi:GNAT superfamily N-acetyltransferase
MSNPFISAPEGGILNENLYNTEDLEMIFVYFAYPKINIDYIHSLLRHPSNRVAFYCFDNVFDIRNCPSCMIYSEENRGDEIIYYITMICTHRKFRGLGYATMLLDGFVETCKMRHKSSRILLSSLDDVVSYYQKYGFEVIDCDLNDYPGLAQFEKCEDDKMYSVMELIV